MRLTVYVLSAAMIGALSVGSANAMPSSSLPAKAAFKSEALQQVDHRPGHWDNRKYKKRGKRHGKHRFRAGGRYAHAPHGWHRYDSRPYGWHTRGCIVVGPVWFCP